MQYQLEVSSIATFLGGPAQIRRQTIEETTDDAAIAAAEQLAQESEGLVGYLLNDKTTVAICYTIRAKEIELGVCTQTTGSVSFFVRSEAEALRRFAATTAPYRKILYGPTGMIANVATGEEATAAE